MATSDLWFAEHTQQIEQAKAMCQACPLKAECLDGALARREPWGVWGGEVLVDGAIVARKRGRGRPRKDDPSAPSNQPHHLRRVRCAAEPSTSNEEYPWLSASCT
ncbi:WhiB family transcriptional regulator [Pseudactinotalea sp. Z1739]|uniref:WhiB family transcriptional regulator n=1 Tax=Pseudactinotalea sp. Z1739 TaxID=3413028 RepID=UPI003C7E1127